MCVHPRICTFVQNHTRKNNQGTLHEQKEGTLLQKAENIVNALELDVLFTTEGNILCDEQEISPKQLVRKVKKGQEKYHLKELKRKTVDGAFF